MTAQIHKLSGNGPRVVTLPGGGFVLVDNSGDRVEVDRTQPLQLGPWGEGLVPTTTGLHTVVWPEHILQLAARFGMCVEDEAGVHYRVTEEDAGDNAR